jgi:hypothetical protein
MIISQRKKRRSTSQHRFQLQKKTRESTKSETKLVLQVMTRNMFLIMITYHTNQLIPNNKYSWIELPPSSQALTQKSF